jgi:hypothetical protein
MAWRLDMTGDSAYADTYSNNDMYLGGQLRRRACHISMSTQNTKPSVRIKEHQYFNCDISFLDLR